ncbi:MAG: class I SAM-dependent methyltransferase [Cytophagales bacterium]|nr:MAG: class I SAM-dependent methyltransferase [Cytophagales bacterium]
METTERKQHWENIYQHKTLQEVSWYQPTPETSLSFIAKATLPLDASIIDIGGGDSFLVDELIAKGYQNITVLDISAGAIERAKKRLGEKATLVKWIVSDIVQFEPTEKYDFWHDRAAFHFLTTGAEIQQYIEIAQKAIQPTGKMLIATFSEQGPQKCSGIVIQQYSEAQLEARWQPFFQKIDCARTDHHTPFNTVQNFVFCLFQKS